MVLQDVATKLSVTRFTKGLLRRAGIWSEAGVAANPTPLDTPKSEALAQDVLATYRGNIEIVKALSEHYDFKCLFYWQPTLFQKVHLSEYERGQRAKMSEQFVHRTYEAMRQSRLAERREYSFHDLSLVFADVREPMYIDWAHLGESGNEMIAKRMAGDALSLLIANK